MRTRPKNPKVMRDSSSPSLLFFVMKSEHEMIPGLKTFLKSKGCEVLIDPGGGDFFDVVAVGPKFVGGIELKVKQPWVVLEQAIKRIYYFHWVAVLVPNIKQCRRLMDEKIITERYPDVEYYKWVYDDEDQKDSFGVRGRKKTFIRPHHVMKWWDKVGIWLWDDGDIKIMRPHVVCGPRQKSKHTIKMAKRIVFFQKQGIPNRIAWGHDRGISLMGFQSTFKTMYGKKMIPDQQLLLQFDEGMLDDKIKKINKELEERKRVYEKYKDMDEEEFLEECKKEEEE